jgi:hypothetical protein
LLVSRIAWGAISPILLILACLLCCRTRVLTIRLTAANVDPQK